MTDKKNSSTHNQERKNAMKHNGIFGGIYGLAFIGAAIYFIQHAPTFWAGVFGFFKALFWPAVLMYKLLELLKM
jgi:hypothetical protein